MFLNENGVLNGIPKLDFHSDPAMLGPRWTWWFISFELFADGRGHITTETANATTRQRRRAMLLHLAGPDVQEIFSTLADTGEATDYAAADRSGANVVKILEQHESPKLSVKFEAS